MSLVLRAGAGQTLTSLFNGVMTHGPGLLGLIVGEVTGATLLMDYTSSKRQLASLSGLSIIVSIQQWPDTDDPLPAILGYPNAGDHRLRCCTLKGKFRYLGQDYTSIVAIQGHTAFLAEIGAKLNHACEECLDPESIINGPLSKHLMESRIGTSVPHAVYYYFNVSARELVDVFLCANINLQTKITTAYFTWMPLARLSIMERCSPCNLPDGVVNAINARSPNEPSDMDVAIVCGIGLLSPAFSVKENMPRQIDARIKAACAAADIVPPGITQVSDMCSSVMLTPLDTPSTLMAVYASVVARDLNGDVDPDVTTQQLMTIEKMQEEYRLDAWQVEMITQMRLVFSYFHSTTVKFGTGILEVAEKYLSKLGDRFTDEVIACRAASGVLANCRYTGIRSKIPDGLQVKTTARLCVIGLEYYRKCLTTDEEKKNFSRYAIGGIKNHILPTDDIEMCMNVVNVLPEANIASVIRMGQSLSYEEMDTILVKYTPEERLIVYKSLCSKPNPGEWASTKKEIDENIAFGTFLDQGLLKLHDLEVQRDAEFTAKMRHAPNQAASDDIRKIFTAWHETVSDLKRGMVGIDQLLPPASEPRFRVIRTRALTQLDALYQAIKGTTQTVATPDDQPAI